MQEIQEFFTTAFMGFGITDAIDILIVAFVVYKIMKFIFETRAEQIFKGILVLVMATFLSDIFNLHTLNWMCKGAVTLGAVAVLIVFQPELRRALEFMGRGKFVKASITQADKEQSKEVVSAIVSAVRTFSREKTGALIVFERNTVLEDISETGTLLEAKISEQLLGNIFYEGSPLHDGAVIISDRIIYAAGCVLPLTKRQDISKSLGTRHRAGIGITENSDALVIIVSEETGIISMAEDGRLERFIDAKTVEKRLLEIYLKEKSGLDRFTNIPEAMGLFGKKKPKDEADHSAKTTAAPEAPSKSRAEEARDEELREKEINESFAEAMTEGAKAAAAENAAGAKAAAENAAAQTGKEDHNA